MRKEKNKTLAVLLSLLLFSVSVGCKGLSAGDGSSEKIEEVILNRWPEQCRALKSKWVKQPQMGIVFSAVPQNQFQLPLWYVRLKEKEFPVIPAQYTEVKITYDEVKKQYSILLLGSKGEFIHIDSGSSLEPLSGWDASIIDPNSNPEDVSQWAVKFLGRPPKTVEKLYSIALQHKPERLTCLPGVIREEMRIANAINIKSVFPAGNLNSAYSLLDKDKSWLISSETEKYKEWNVFFGDEEMSVRFVTMRVPKNSAYHDAGLVFNTKSESSKSTIQSPDWLLNLVSAIENDDYRSWKVLSNSLESLGIDNSSIEKILTEKSAF